MTEAGTNLIPKTLKLCADNYASATQFPCLVLDATGETIYSTANYSGCGFCKHVSSCGDSSISCNKAHQYGMFQSYRFAGKYIYFCPLGLVHWTSAYLTEDEKMYSLLCGPVHLVEPDQFMLNDFLKKHGIDDLLQKKLLTAAKEIPILSSERLDSLSDLLVANVIYHNGRNLSDINHEVATQQQQSDIWSYISGMKYIWDEEDSGAYPIEKEKELLLLISSGNVSSAKEILNEILGKILFTTGDFHAIKSRVFELIVLLSRASIDAGAGMDEIFGLEHSFIDQLQSINNMDELTGWLSETLERFNKSIFALKDVKHSDSIYKIVNYVKKNYMKRITLNDVSALVALSPTYLSRIFKTEMNESFVTWLNHFRIERSKKFLLDASIPLIEVSAMCGFEDQSYFSKVFKGHTGVSPGKFRESRGRISLPLINII